MYTLYLIFQFFVKTCLKGTFSIRRHLQYFIFIILTICSCILLYFRTVLGHILTMMTGVGMAHKFVKKELMQIFDTVISGQTFYKQSSDRDRHTRPCPCPNPRLLYSELKPNNCLRRDSFGCKLVMFLSFETDSLELDQEQSDQCLHCLPFHLNLLET